MVKEFLKHLFPRVVLAQNMRFTYTFCLGGLAFTTFIILGLSGLLLLLYYQPSPQGAYQSVLLIESSVFGGFYLRSIHRLSSHFFLVLILLHLLRVLLTGAFDTRKKMNWVIGFFLLCFAVFAGYSGYLLPMDQLAYWATQTGMELVRLLPAGDFLRQILVPDGVGQPMSLLRFYVLHVVMLPLGLIVLSFLHFYRIRKQKGILPYL